MSENGLRVCHVIDEFHPIFSGHGEYLKRLMKEMAGRGYSFQVITRLKCGSPTTDEFEGIKITRIPDSAGYPAFILSVLSALFRLRRTYDIIHLNGLIDTLGIVVLFSRIFRKKVVTHLVLLGADDPETFQRAHKLPNLRLRALAFMDGFIAISNPLCDKYAGSVLPDSKLSLIPTSVDLANFLSVSSSEKRDIRRRLGFDPDAGIVVFVGTIMRRKGVDILVDAWEKVQEECGAAQLALVGLDRFDNGHVSQGELTEYVDALREQIERSRLNVVFTGLTDNVADHLKMADVFAFPSRSEGLGNVIIEAMGCGLPCVVTPMDGVAHDTVDHEVSGFIVESTDQLASRITQLLKDKKLAASMGKAGRLIAEEKFDLGKIAAEHDRVYRAL